MSVRDKVFQTIPSYVALAIASGVVASGVGLAVAFKAIDAPKFPETIKTIACNFFNATNPEVCGAEAQKPVEKVVSSKSTERNAANNYGLSTYPEPKTAP